MARIVRVKNTLADNAQKSYSSTSLSAAGTTTPVQNTNAFEASWAVQIGSTGEEKTEVKLLGTATPSGTALNTTSGLTYDHPTDTPVYAIKYDQVVFYKSTSGTAGTATVITGGTVSITADSEVTQFDDPTAGTADAYRALYRNSVTAEETDLSDWLEHTGYSFYSLAKMRERVRDKIFNSDFIPDARIDGFINEWLENMSNTAIDVNRDYLLSSTDVAHGTDGLATVTASDFKEVRKVWYTTNGSDWYPAIKMENIDFDPSEVFNNTVPYYYFAGDRVIGKKPDGTSGTARVTYYKRPPVLNSEADTLPESMWSYTKSFVDYARAQSAYMDGKMELGDRYLGFANEGREMFKKQIAPRHKSGIQTIHLDSPIDGENSGLYYI